MGSTFSARCNQCGHEFVANQGGGLIAASFHCMRCGVEERVQRFAGEAQVPDPCACGGTFSQDAGPRCPKCRSDDWQQYFDPENPGLVWD